MLMRDDNYDSTNNDNDNNSGSNNNDLQVSQSMLGFLLTPNGLQVLHELHSYRRTTSTEDFDSPLSNPDSPGWVMNMRSQSLIALGLGPASPHTQRQFLASGKRQNTASVLGAKQLPEQASHASGSRLAALPGQVPEHGADAQTTASAAKDGANHGGFAARNGGQNGGKNSAPSHASRSGGKQRLSRFPPNSRVAAAGRSRLTKYDSQASGSALSGVRSGLDSHPSPQRASSSSAEVSSGEEEAEEEGDNGLKDQVPSPVGRGNLRVDLRVRRNKRRAVDARAGMKKVKNVNVPSDEEDWTESPVTRSSRGGKQKSGLRKGSASTNPRSLFARRAATAGGRQRSEKLSNFSGVTLKNGRCGDMTQHRIGANVIAVDKR